MAAYDFPNSPSDGDTVTVSGVTYTYNSSKTRWDGAAASGSSTTVYATIDLLPLSGASTGDQAYVSGNNRLYLWNGTGWYNIALINTTPSISGASATYDLATDGTATTVTITATDPEGIPITYSIASDTSGNIATVSQGTGSNTNVFTITPSTNAANAGTFSLTFRASDGVNIATAVSSFTLVFTVSNSNYTTALITSVGANNAVNNSFDDASTNNHTITANGNVTQNTFSPYRRGGYSAYFDGTGDYLGAGGSSNNESLSGDFCIEAWIYPTGTNDGTILGNYLSGPNRGWSIRSYTNNNLYLYFQINGGSQIVYQTATDSVNPKEWNHVVWCRSGTNTSVFINGTRADNRTLSGTAAGAGGVAVGSLSQGFVGYHFTGYISDARVVNGSAVYDPSQTTLSEPTERLTAVTNTSLLTCHLPYLSDGSSNSHSIAVNGDVKTEPLGPYDYGPYLASSHGGSAYFDGNGDYLSVPSSAEFNVSSGAWTAEAWVYSTGWTTPISQHIFSAFYDSNNRSSLYYNSSASNITYWSNGSPRIEGGALYPNQWYHLVVTSDGTTTTLYVNGVSKGTTTYTQANQNMAIYVGTAWNGAGTTNGYMDGYISDFRFAKGTAVYTSAFTPPTAPLTAITNTSLLLPFDDAGIIDKSQSVKSITVYGNTKSSTDYYKYLTSSMYFDGTGDYLSADDNNVGDFGTQDFTAEGWFYLTASPANYIAICETRGSGATTTGWAIAINAAGSFYVYSGAFLCQAPNSSISSNTWYHWAYSRASGNHRLFIDGTQVGSTSTTSRDYTDTNFRIGGNFAGAELFTGYQSDVRITKGYARYTANFTKPSAALQG